MNNEEATQVMKTLYNRVGSVPKKPLHHPVLRVIDPPDPGMHSAAAQELSRSSNEKHARHRAHYEGVSRLTVMRGKIRDIPSYIELICSDVETEIHRRAGVEANLLGNVATASDKARIGAHNVIFTWIDTRLRLKTEPVFVRPSLGLTYRLLLTDTKKVRGTDLKFPFPAFNVFVPPGLIYLQHSITKEHEVTHLSIAENVITPAFAENFGITLLEPLRSLVVAVYAKQGSASTDGFDFMHSIAHAPLTDEEPSLINAESGEGNFVRVGKSMLSFSGFSNFLVGFATNLLLYLNGSADLVLENADDIARLEKKVRASKKPRKTDVARLKKAKEHNIYTTGTSIRVDPGLEEALLEGVSSGARWNLTYKTLVRGHWRNQAHGPGRGERKMIWINPHVRGPDFADRVATHTYTAD